VANRGTLTEPQRRLLEIISSVENGIYTPEEAVTEFQDIKRDMEKAGLPLAPEYALAEYTLADFQRIRENALASYESNDDSFEGVFYGDETYEMQGDEDEER
jgi:hypothetical protein